MVDDTPPETLQCTTCLLPMQYQTIKDGKFLWQCFKCGKQLLAHIPLQLAGNPCQLFMIFCHMPSRLAQLASDFKTEVADDTAVAEQ